MFNKEKSWIPGHKLPPPCCCLVTKWYLTLLWFHGLWPSRLLCQWDFPGKNTGVGCHFLLQGTFPTQGLNPCFLNWQLCSLPLSHLESPCILYSEDKRISLKKFKHRYFMKRYKVLDVFFFFSCSVQDKLGVIKTMNRVQLEHTIIFWVRDYRGLN